jgi:AraC family transcriptional regulator of adaptative response/methylated-DNA-[protein]-cysteine methyltransferase
MQYPSLKMTSFDTELGPMMALASESHLYLLEFLDKKKLEAELENLKLRTKAEISKGITKPIQSIQEELKHYFKGTLKEFKTPLCLSGTDFQKQVWGELLRTPYGKTRSYAAQALGKPTAYRAVANANGANQLVIVVPCHRIISSKGDLGGYSSGLERKKWLIEHEREILVKV